MRYRNQTRGAASVVVIGVNTHGMGLIRECLGTEAVLPTQSTPYQDAVQIVQKTRPNVIIMGFDTDFDAAVELGPRLTAELAGLHLVAISERTDPERIRSAMRAGYREYVVLPEDAPLLRQAVHDAAYGTEQQEDLGEVIAVVGAKGGLGATLIATNLAAELSALHQVCLADLDFSMGDVAAFLDLKPSSSILDLVENLHRLDSRLFKGSVAIHPGSKLQILSQPNELSPYTDLRDEDLIRILGIAAETYQYVFVDCGSHIDVATLTATTAADRILLICTPDVVSVKNAWRRLQMLEHQKIEQDTIRLVLNQWEKGAEVSDRDIEANLKIPIAARLRKDDACRKSVSLGQLVREVDRRSPFVADIAAATSLITEGADKVETAEGRRAFGWLFR
jgi:pilus assembly protein CpaE